MWHWWDSNPRPLKPLSHQGCDRAALGLRPQNHESAEVSAVKSPRMDRWHSGNSLGRERNAMVALGRLTAATVLCMHKMVAEAQRSDQIAVRTQYSRSGSAKRAAWAQSERSKDAHKRLVVAARNKSCALRLYWVLTTSSAMSLRLSSVLVALLLRYYGALLTSSRLQNIHTEQPLWLCRSLYAHARAMAIFLGPCWWAVMW